MIEAELQRLLADAGTHEEVAAGASDLSTLGVLVVHEASYHELLIFATEKLGIGFHLNFHYASDLEEGLRVARESGTRIDAIFVEFSLIVDVGSLIARFGQSPHLQQIVVICASDEEVTEFESLPYSDSLATLRECDTPAHFIEDCRLLLERLCLRAQIIEHFLAQRELLAVAETIDDLQRAMTPLVRNLAGFFGVDALLVADLKTRSSEIVAVLSDTSGIRPLLRRVARREQAKLEASQEAELRLLASLVGDEVGNKLDSKASTLRSTEFAELEADSRLVRIAYAYAMHDSLVSSFVIAPHRPVVFETLMCQELRDSLEAWARQHEKLKMVALREKLEAEREAAKVSLQDSLTELVCGVSHEINTPLGIIRTAAAVVADLANEAKDEQTDKEELALELSDASGMIESNVLRLGELVERFKAVAVSQAPETAAETPIVTPIDQAIERISSRNLVVHKIIDADAGADIWFGYPRRLEEVIYLLLENISQHAYDAKGGLAQIYLRARNLEGEPRYSAIISDYGVGIEPEVLPRIFELFFTTSRQARAPGLGLAIAKSLVSDAIGGDIRCESTPGMGTVFYLDFKNVQAPSGR